MKIKVEKRSSGPLNLLEVAYWVVGGRACNNGCPPFCLHPWYQKQQSAIRAHIPNIRRTESFLLVLAPTSCVQAAAGTSTQLLATWQAVGPWVAASMLRTETDQN